jgi:hypothetical protein
MEISMTDAFPWKDWVTRQIPVKALEIGKDIQLEGPFEEGDFLIQNPDPLDAQTAPFFHCPRENFLEHYQPAGEVNVTSQEADQEDRQEDPQETRT